MEHQKIQLNRSREVGISFGHNCMLELVGNLAPCVIERVHLDGCSLVPGLIAAN